MLSSSSDVAPALRIFLIDDEPLARLRLRQLLADMVVPTVTVVGEAGSAAAALQWLSQHRADLLLLDIRMPGLDGLALAERLRHWHDVPAVVFVTAHPEHALAAFDVEAFDYLTKPVRRVRLQEALMRVMHRLGRAPRTMVETTHPMGLEEEPAIMVSVRGQVIRVPLTEVLYLKAELKYVTLRTARSIFVLDESLTDLEPRLGPRFLRVHRNALVARQAIRELMRRPAAAPDSDDERDGGELWSVLIAEVDEWLTVSRRQLPAVREALVAEGL
ncbi:MAG: LytR/AlgR family response regulator transcription factor [Leptothrix ochracea]|uniref:LytR/AlgR family response regulator transcription factor n=1 Tax=Leptothrix ochracea TaxID=735331 RepID=UPI0034E27DDF